MASTAREAHLPALAHQGRETVGRGVLDPEER
jgi:hypothetical protein